MGTRSWVPPSWWWVGSSSWACSCDDVPCEWSTLSSPCRAAALLRGLTLVLLPSRHSHLPNMLSRTPTPIPPHSLQHELAPWEPKQGRCFIFLEDKKET